MSDDEYNDFINFLKAWSRNFFNHYDPPESVDLERRDTYGEWSKNFLSHYDKAEDEKETKKDDTIAFIERVTSDFLDWLDGIEDSKNNKKKR